MSEEKKEKEKMVVLGEVPGGSLLTARTYDGGIELGAIKPLADGESAPEGSSIIHYERREDGMYDYEYITGPRANGGSGPAKVNSRAYRNNWDSIFGKKIDKTLN